MRRILLIIGTVALVAAGAAGFIGLGADAADHRDSPVVEADPAADITDIYAFRSAENADNLVVYLGVNGVTSPAEQAERNFATDVAYNIHVDNTGDLVADATAAMTFSGDPLTFTVAGLGPDITGPVTAVDAKAPEITEAAGVKVFAGPRDDPFFFDLTGFKNFVAGPFVPVSGLRPAGEDPADFFEGTNVTAIVIELPVVALTSGADANSGAIKAWATTKRGATQVDRMAIPAINTALIPSAQKQAFNEGDPATDVASFQATAQTTIEGLRTAVDTAFGSPQDGGPLGDLTPAAVAGALIPDIVTIDFSQPVQFPNGRRLEDDVINAALGIVLNRGGAAGISDAVDGNDVAFGTTFPFLAAPHAQAAATATAPAPTALPPTGAGDISSDSEGGVLPWIILAAAAALGAALLGSGLYARRARS